MTAASPLLASVDKRALAALIDAGPLLLFAIFAVALAEYLRLGSTGNAATAVLIYVAYHAAFNHYWSGETPGRRMMHIRLVSSHGDGLSMIKAVLRPIVRALWICTFIYGAFRAHAPWVAAIPLVIDLLFVSVLHWRQSTADFVCGTIVVNSPAVQPHRAPAGPMYSATDAEFGNAPKRIK